MKLDKKIIIILALSSLLLSSIGGAFYLYTQNKKIVSQSNMIKVVYIADKNITKNTKVTKEDIKAIKISSMYILTPPLLENEIVGKYARENIYQNDTFRKEKLSDGIVEENKDLAFTYTSYNIEFKLFSNPNYSLRQGDYINIISVFPAENTKDNMSYAVQYVAKNIPVLGFLEKGKEVSIPFRGVKQKVKQKSGKEELVDVVLFADELVLDIQQDVIVRLLDDYNKGRQLWMVKVKNPFLKNKEGTITEPIVEKIELPKQSIEKLIKVQKTERKEITRRNERNYPYKWYAPKQIVIVQEATITYANTNKVEQSHKTTIPQNDISKCSDRKNLLVGVSHDVSLRLKPSVEAKKHDVVEKNTIIPYIKMVDENWYEVCDGSFVHKNQVETISLEEAMKKIYGK